VCTLSGQLQSASWTQIGETGDALALERQHHFLGQ
jgi:hypothetical protein